MKKKRIKGVMNAGSVPSLAEVPSGTTAPPAPPTTSSSTNNPVLRGYSELFSGQKSQIEQSAEKPFTDPLQYYNFERQLKLKQISTRRIVGLVLFIVGCVGFLIMFLWALWSNYGLIAALNQSNYCNPVNDTECPEIQAYVSILGSRLSGTRLAMANTFPVLTRFLGYQNSYTPSIISGMQQFYNMPTTDLIKAMFYLETGMAVSPVCNLNPAGCSGSTAAPVNRSVGDSPNSCSTQNAQYPYPPTLWQTVFNTMNRQPAQPCNTSALPTAASNSGGWIAQVLPYFNIFAQISGLLLMSL
jgi:hypothetical protein